MIEMVFVVCMLGSPSDCKDEKLSFNGGPMACVQFGQVAIAEWAASHPKWAVRKWTCGRPSRVI